MSIQTIQTPQALLIRTLSRSLSSPSTLKYLSLTLYFHASSFQIWSKSLKLYLAASVVSEPGCPVLLHQKVSVDSTPPVTSTAPGFLKSTLVSSARRENWARAAAPLNYSSCWGARFVAPCRSSLLGPTSSPQQVTTQNQRLPTSLCPE